MNLRKLLHNRLSVIVSIALTAGFARADVLTTDGFEGSLGNWTAEGTTTLYTWDGVTVPNYAKTGSGAARIESKNVNALTLSSPLSLGSRAYTSVTISFDYIGSSVQGTRRVYIRYSSDAGANWQDLGYVTLPGSFSSKSYTITPDTYSFSENALFQFYSGTQSGGTHYMYIDNVVITATPDFVGAYWDLNGTTAGAGSATPAGTWDATTPNWNALADGTGATNAWTSGITAVFAAGTDATGAYTVTVDGTQAISGLVFQEGAVTLSGGVLQMTTNSSVYVPAALTATVASAFSEDATARKLSKTGAGKLVLSGNNVNATGGMSLLSGVTQFEAPAAINGTARNVTVTSPGIVVFGGSSFDIAATLSGRIVATSTGTIAADNYAGTDFNFSTAGLTAASLGAVGTVNYTGTLTPNGTTYRLGGAGGTLTLNSALDSANALVVVGPGTAQLNGNSSTVTSLTSTGSGAVLENGNATTPVTLTVNNSGAITYAGILQDGTGSQPLTLVKTNAGTLTLSGVNTFSGGLVINGGNITMGTSAVDSLGAVNATVTVNTNTTLTVTGAITFQKSFVLNNGATLRFLNGANNPTTVTGPVTGNGGIAANDAAGVEGRTLLLSSTSNTFSGPIWTVLTSGGGGTLAVNSLWDGPGAGAINLQTLNSGQYNNGEFMYWSGAITPLVLNYRQISFPRADTGFLGIIKNNAGTTNTITINTDLLVAGSGTKTLQLGGSNTNNNTFAGAIIDGSGIVSLKKADAGKWVLSGNNTFSGTTTVSDGTLVLAGSQCLSDTNLLFIASGKFVQLEAGVKEKVGGLVLGTVTNTTPAIWGAIGNSQAQTNSASLLGTGLLYVNTDLPASGTVIQFK